MSNFLANNGPSAAAALAAGLLSGVPLAEDLLTAFAGPQTFATIPVTNTRLALYTLAIISPGSTIPYSSYTFPISPAAISKSYTSYSTMYDVAGPTATNGVQRVIDIYGNSPVTYMIQGTTGWKLHATDGYSFTGVQSILTLQQFLNLYASQNAGQAAANQPPYTLELYDYFTGDFWQVEPMGQQEISQSKDKPLLLNYSFKLVGVANLSNPLLQLVDSLSSLLQNPAPQILGALGNTISSTLSSYASQTPGAASLFGG